MPHQTHQMKATPRNVNSRKEKNKVDQPMAIFDVFAGHSMADYDSSVERVLMRSLAYQNCKLLECVGPRV